MNNGLTSPWIKTFAINGNDVFAGSYGEGLFYSSNNGNNWVNKGLTNKGVFSLKIEGNYIYAGTENEGVWKRQLSEITGIVNNISETELFVSPNPVKDYLILKLKKSQILQNSSISIYNIQGQLLLHDNLMQSPTVLNIAEFAKGIYILKIYNDKETLQEKFVKE
jgi:hypothetical protein